MTETSEEYLTLDEHGLMIAVNIHTGEVRPLESSLIDPSKALDLSKFHRVRAQTGELVYVSSTLPLEELDKIQGKARTFPYSPLLADRICEQIASGKTLVEISKTPGMPSYATIAKWRIRYPEFDEMYKQARKDRAEYYFHQMLEEVKNASADRDEVALARLRADFLKFAAKVSSPDEYAEKTTLDARVATTSFVIETGIRRPQDAGFNRDETKHLDLLSPDAPHSPTGEENGA